MTGAPDFVEPVDGWRVWRLLRRGGTVRLQSVISDLIWSPRAEAVASCPRRSCLWAGIDVHAAPAWECVCGIHAAREPFELTGYLDICDPQDQWPARVIGRVSLWGRLVECQRGWRGSHAYPSCLYFPVRETQALRPEVVEDIVEALGQYGVPVEVVPCSSWSQAVVEAMARA